MPGGLGRTHQLQLLLGRHTRKDMHLAHQRPELLGRLRLEFKPSQRSIPLFGNAHIAGDRERRFGMVASDHGHLQPRMMALGNGFNHAGPQGVNHTHIAQKLERLGLGT